MTGSLEALPARTFSEEQKLELLSVAAMCRESDRNDVFHQLIWPVVSKAGKLDVIIILDYDVSLAVLTRLLSSIRGGTIAIIPTLKNYDEQMILVF